MSPRPIHHFRATFITRFGLLFINVVLFKTKNSVAIEATYLLFYGMTYS